MTPSLWQARLDRAISECKCVVALQNHLSNSCRCNIFKGMICNVHHTLRCIKLYSENRHATREHSDAFWLMEASKELNVSVEELKERNLPENRLYVAISSVQDEINNANIHKFLREHPGWKGFGSPPTANMCRKQPKKKIQ